MTIKTLLPALLLSVLSSLTTAQEPVPQAPLPALKIDDRGELIFDNEKFTYASWSTEQNPGKVHVVQYFGGTMSDSERFKPFTDLLVQDLELGSYHVTTIINLDAALWGTTGFVVSEIKDSKREFPMSTLVLDEEGTGARTWSLGKDGAGLAILDRDGTVLYFTRDAMSEQQLNESLALVKSRIDS